MVYKKRNKRKTMIPTVHITSSNEVEMGQKVTLNYTIVHGITKHGRQESYKEKEKMKLTIVPGDTSAYIELAAPGLG